VRLFRTEWSRLFARRFTSIMIVLVVVILGLVAVGVAASSQRPGPELVAKAKVQADRNREQIRQLRAECEAYQRDPNTAGEPPEMRRFPPDIDCARAFDPGQVRDEDFLPHTFSFRAEAPNLVLVLAGLLALLSFAVGSSFVGAEWSSGSMMNLLTWRPRRVSVLLTKLAALLSGLLLVALVLAGAWAATLYAIARWRGRVGEVTAGSLTSLGLDNARAIGLALAAAVIGFAFASLGRHTATALGVVVAWALVLEIGLRIVLGIAEVSRVERWFLSSYAAAWLVKKATFADFSGCRFAEGPCEPTVWSLTMNQGALVLGSATLLVLVIAVLAMRRRDVT
jgi:ABC-2 type transport system permease protein